MIITKDNSVITTVRIPIEDYEILKEIRSDQDRTTSEIIRRALRSYIIGYLQRKEKNKNGKN